MKNFPITSRWTFVRKNGSPTSGRRAPVTLTVILNQSSMTPFWEYCLAPTTRKNCSASPLFSGDTMQGQTWRWLWRFQPGPWRWEVPYSIISIALAILNCPFLVASGLFLCSLSFFCTFQKKISLFSWTGTMFQRRIWNPGHYKDISSHFLFDIGDNTT